MHDLIVIGAGSAGVAASRYAASLGARVALCEADRVGGTCVLRGCVPKKLYVYAAQFADAFADAAAFGWQVGRTAFSLPPLRAAKDAETRRLEGIYLDMLQRAGVELLAGHARLGDAGHVEINGRSLPAGRILIASGGRPRRPPIPGIELAMTSDDILDLDDLPERLLVIGSGYIGVEFAGIFRGFGSAVTVAGRSELPLRGFDADLCRRLVEETRRRGIDWASGFDAARIERAGTALRCIARDGRVLEADAILNATGRTPNSAGLGLEAIGVELDDDGAIAVDARSRSRVPGVFAVGDVTNRLNLTPVAIAEARAFVDSEFGNTPRQIDHGCVASAVFSQPPLAAIGLDEAAARRAGHALRVYEADFRPMRNAFSGRAERSYMKLVVDADSDRVLGAHMIGTDAAEIIQSLAPAVTHGLSKRQFDQTLALHPTAAEEFFLMRTPRA
ncbi:MAG: glutathione-disulfide reductase [Lysobacteraceae bacterium]